MRTLRLAVAGAVILVLLGGLSGVTAQEPSPQMTAATAQAEQLPDYIPAELDGRPLYPVPVEYSGNFPSVDSAIEEAIEFIGGDPATAETTLAVNYDMAGLMATLEALDPNDPADQAAADVLLDDYSEWMENGLYVSATHMNGISGMQLLDGILEEHSIGRSPLVKSTIGERTFVAVDRSGVAGAGDIQWGLMYPSGNVLFVVWGYGPRTSAPGVLASVPDLPAE